MKKLLFLILLSTAALAQNTVLNPSTSYPTPCQPGQVRSRYSGGTVTTKFCNAAGSGWTDISGSGGGSGDLVSTNNLSDVASVSTARTNLGLAIGTDVQAYDAQLASLAGISYTGNALKVLRVNAGETGFELATGGGGSGDLVSTNNLSDVASASTARSNLGLAIGTNVQAYDADLAAIAALTPSDEDVIQRVAGAWTNRSMTQLKSTLAYTKNDVGLGSVENTALSTWTGSTNITTLGTIATGNWQGSVIGSAYGGAGTVSGVLKANGSGTVSAAVSGTDYAPATSGSAILYGNGSGGFSSVTIGSGLSFSGGTLSASGGGGASSPLTLTASSASEIPLTLKGAASQTGQHFRVLNSSDTEIFRINSAGTIGAAFATQAARNYIDFQSAGTLSFFKVSEVVSGNNATMTLGYSSGTIQTATGTGAITVTASGYASTVLNVAGGIAIPSFGVTGYTTPNATVDALVNFNPTALILYGNTTDFAVQRIGVTAFAGNTTGRTITNASTLLIDGAPTQGANETITNLYSIFVKGGAVRFDGILYLKDGTVKAVEFGASDSCGTGYKCLRIAN